MAKVFITGPDGLLGSNLVRELLFRKYEVVAMVLKGNVPSTLRDMPLNIVYGDITDKESLTELSKGCEYFIHIAAITDTWPSRGSHYYEVNVKGTKNAIDAALANNVKRFIHVGSAGSFGFGTLDNPGNENSSYRSGKYKLDYLDSKKEGQDLVIRAVKERNLPAIVVCPTFMIGPYDSKPSSGSLVIAIARMKLPAVSQGGKNWVATKDVASAICNSLVLGTIGESYILGGENMPFKVAVRRIAGALGQTRYPEFEMPDFVIKTIGFFGSLAGRISGKTPKISYTMARIACDGHYFNQSKAVEELKMPQTPIEEAVVELKEWFQENGYL